MRREKYVPRGGPDGGDGGRGADVILKAELGVNSLADFVGRSIIKAKNGTPGQGSMRHGRNAKDMTLKVPPGTTVIDREGGFVIKDLKRPGDSVVIAGGGRGGRGNASFKSATNRAPREKTPGGAGEVRRVVLELKSIADVGLLGKPNAGKSTLLSRITSARPEIADYPFTTKHPNLGIVELDARRSFVIADIPGLIEGASEGVGLGHEFLKHVERAGLLVHLVEPEPIDGTDPIENYHAIREELLHYDAALAQRREIVVVTKNELPAAAEVTERLRTLLDHQAEESTDDASDQPTRHPVGEVMSISAMTGDGLDALVARVHDDVETMRREIVESGGEVTPLRASDLKPNRIAKRVPPHKAGLTANLSDSNQAKDFVPPDSDAAENVADNEVADPPSG